MDILRELLVPLLLAFVAGAVAVFWPWLQIRHRGRKFEGIIRRELQEIGPHPAEPVPGRPWWEHAKKRFIHEEIFARERVSDNREFLLSLDPTVVYTVNQLWIALAKRDGIQWVYFLGKLANSKRVGGEAVLSAHKQWDAIMNEQPSVWREPPRARGPVGEVPVVESISGLFEHRLDRYSALVAMMPRLGQEQQEERGELSKRMTDWYFSGGAGLLLSGRAVRQFFIVRESLSDADLPDEAIHVALSLLRTDLKIDLGIREADERLVELAMPANEVQF